MSQLNQSAEQFSVRRAIVPLKYYPSQTDFLDKIIWNSCIKSKDTISEERLRSILFKCLLLDVPHLLYTFSLSHSTQAYENFVSGFSQPRKQSPADQKISEWSQTLVENKGDLVLLKTFWKQSPQANRALNSGLCCRFLLKHILQNRKWSKMKEKSNTHASVTDWKYIDCDSYL